MNKLFIVLWLSANITSFCLANQESEFKGRAEIICQPYVKTSKFAACTEKIESFFLHSSKEPCCSDNSAHNDLDVVPDQSICKEFPLLEQCQRKKHL